MVAWFSIPYAFFEQRQLLQSLAKMLCMTCNMLEFSLKVTDYCDKDGAFNLCQIKWLGKIEKIYENKAIYFYCSRVVQMGVLELMQLCKDQEICPVGVMQQPNIWLWKYKYAAVNLDLCNTFYLENTTWSLWSILFFQTGIYSPQMGLSPAEQRKR